jgi:A/G-specific adenine glycosylase
MNVSQRRRTYFRKKLLEWHSSSGRSFPWRARGNPFEVLLAEVLLQRTQAPQVAQYYETIVTRFPNPEALRAASVDTIAETIRPLGLAKRAPLLKRLGEDLSERFSGEVPRDVEQLASLPGVGPYIAHATACFAFNLPTAVVDANIIRVFKRFFGIRSSRARAREDKGIWGFAQDLVPPRKARAYNMALIDFALSVCRPRSPLCSNCPMLHCCNHLRAPVERRGEGR